MNTIDQLLLIGQEAGRSQHEWTNSFFGLEDGQRFTIIIVAIGCATAIVIALGGIIAGVSNSLHRRRSEMDLKRDMIDRGMSAEEITKVIEAAPPPEDAFARVIAGWGKAKKK